MFDVAFGADCPNGQVYHATIDPIMKHVVNGHNCTVFAYGATGSGKTYTMVGTASDPGLMIRSMEALFSRTSELSNDEEVSINASYLEVYNEVRLNDAANFFPLRSSLNLQNSMSVGPN
jgi:kinesin family member 18/19